MSAAAAEDGGMTLGGAIGQGVLIGLWASWFKAKGPLSEVFLQRIAEAIAPPSPEQKELVGTDPIGHPKNMPPGVLMDKVAAAFGGQLSDEGRQRAQLRIHYTVGTTAGVIYSLALRRWPVVTRGAGGLYGLAVYAGGHGSLVWILGITPPPWRLPASAVMWEAASHAVYGAALEMGRRALGAVP